MSKTLELLEAIGRDASLRHASPETLTAMLEQAEASEALTCAVIWGDRSHLFAELGHRPMCEPQVVQTHSPGHEEDEPEEEGEENPHDLRISGHAPPCT